MLARCCFYLAALLLATASPCRADRVYRLVDYPANQNGHFLKGTITTTDDAPSDSLLNVAEILNWQWSISGANTFAASNVDYLTETSTTFNVRISSATISLPFGLSPFNGSLQLGRRSSLGGRGELEHAITWFTSAGRDGPYASSNARRHSGDAIQGFWGGPATFPTGSGWVIAVAVPEPASVILLAACAMVCVVRRRHC